MKPPSNTSVHHSEVSGSPPEVLPTWQHQPEYGVEDSLDQGDDEVPAGERPVPWIEQPEEQAYDVSRISSNLQKPTDEVNTDLKASCLHRNRFKELGWRRNLPVLFISLYGKFIFSIPRSPTWDWVSKINSQEEKRYILRKPGSIYSQERASSVHPKLRAERLLWDTLGHQVMWSCTSTPSVWCSWSSSAPGLPWRPEDTEFSKIAVAVICGHFMSVRAEGCWPWRALICDR